MNTPSARWLTHNPELFDGKPFFVRSQTQVNALLLWVSTGLPLKAFLSLHPDLDGDVAREAITLGFVLLIDEYVAKGKFCLASLSVTHDAAIHGGRPIFIDSHTQVTDLANWLVSGEGIESFLTKHPDVDEGYAKCTAELALGYLSKDYYDAVDSPPD